MPQFIEYSCSTDDYEGELVDNEFFHLARLDLEQCKPFVFKSQWGWISQNEDRTFYLTPGGRWIHDEGVYGFLEVDASAVAFFALSMGVWPLPSVLQERLGEIKKDALKSIIRPHTATAITAQRAKAMRAKRAKVIADASQSPFDPAKMVAAGYVLMSTRAAAVEFGVGAGDANGVGLRAIRKGKIIDYRLDTTYKKTRLWVRLRTTTKLDTLERET
jgi:hypothetical protein